MLKNFLSEENQMVSSINNVKNVICCALVVLVSLKF